MYEKFFLKLRIIQLSFTLTLILLLSGCGEDGLTGAEKEAKFEITSTSTGVKSYGAPYIIITVKNTGNATGYNASCDVQAKIGNTIIDAGFAYFASGGSISVGESAIDEAIFFDLTSHSDYDNLKYELDWLTR